MPPRPPAPVALDLTSCAKEPIRFPGSIQPHGFLLCRSSRLAVLQASDNLAAKAGIEAAAAIGNAAARALATELHLDKIGPRPAYLCTIGLDNGAWVALTSLASSTAHSACAS